MSNEFHFAETRTAVDAAFAEVQVPVRWLDTPAQRASDAPITPTAHATILRAIDPTRPRAGLEGMDMRWWLVPYFHKGPVKDWRTLTSNAALDTVDTGPTFRNAYQARRCLVPLTAFIAYSEPPGWKKGLPKMRHEITWGGGVRYVAGLWDHSLSAERPEGLDSFAILTGPAGPDLLGVSDSAPVVLTLDQGLAWLDLDGPGKAAFADPAHAGTYAVAHAPRDVVMSAEMRRLI